MWSARMASMVMSKTSKGPPPGAGSASVAAFALGAVEGAAAVPTCRVFDALQATAANAKRPRAVHLVAFAATWISVIHRDGHRNRAPCR
jgi:hypothetical protein